MTISNVSIIQNKVSILNKFFSNEYKWKFYEDEKLEVIIEKMNS